VLLDYPIKPSTLSLPQATACEVLAGGIKPRTFNNRLSNRTVVDSQIELMKGD